MDEEEVEARAQRARCSTWTRARANALAYGADRHRRAVPLAVASAATAAMAAAGGLGPGRCATMVSMGLEFRAGRCDESPGRELLDELIEHLNAQYPGRAARPGSVTTPDEMVAPHGVFLVGCEDERPVAIGGLRPCKGDVCEIKRMYVAPAARSRGVGRALLGALEDAACDRGYNRVRLDAGPRQEHSKRLFADCGYVEAVSYTHLTLPTICSV